MKTLEQYLNEYAESHQHPLNVILHTICVPLIFWSLLGFFNSWSISDRIGLRGSHVVALAAIIFYGLFKNFRIWLAMFLVIALFCLSYLWIPHLMTVSLVVFVAAWVGQFYGHRVEGKKPSFFQDLVFLLIGPIWVLKKLAPKIFIF